MSTVFTKIIGRELPARIVWEDEEIISFLPKDHFVNPGHLLVVPKQETDYIFDLEDYTYHRLWDVAKMLSGPLKEITNCKRVGIAVEGFSVPHVHIHLCPLYNVTELDPHRKMPWSDSDRDAFKEGMIKLINNIA